jgi:hypothetical protein
MRPVSFAPSLAACKVGMLSATILIVGAGAASAASLFENYLERGYSEVAAYARTKAQNTGVSLHFAQKAADAASGRIVTPDSPADTGRPVAYLAEQYDAHTRLMEVLAAGAAEDNARMAAVAQVNYDCWLAELSAGPGEPDSNACRLLFYTALDHISAETDANDFVTLAGPASTDGDHAAGGNDNPDRSPPGPAITLVDGAPVTSSRQLDAGPISALSPLASGDYTTAAWIYPVPMAMPPTFAPATGTASEHATGAQEDGADESAGTGSGVTGALGGAVDRTSDSLGGTVGGVGGALGDTVGGASAAAGGAISGVGDAVGGPVGGVADTAGDTVSGLGGAAGGAVSGVADAAGGAISGVGGALGGALGGLGKERPN